MAWFVVYSLTLGVAWWKQSLFGVADSVTVTPSIWVESGKEIGGKQNRRRGSA